jgi:hypothetical protein
MRGYEFDREERALTLHDSWRRLFARVAPSVRRDMIGWMGWTGSAMARPQPEPPRDSFADIASDVFVGASLVVDPLPHRDSEFARSDFRAIQQDARDIALDMRLIYECLKSMEHETIEQRPFERERPGRPKDAAE